MAIKAGSEITLTLVVDVKATYRYYLLQSSTLTKPSKPTTYPPSAQWTDTEPDYTSGSTNSLYVVDCTLFCDDTFTYSEVSLSSSYEAAKAAYNKAVNAENSASDANNNVDEVRQIMSEQVTHITSDCEAIILEALTRYTETGDFDSFRETTEAQLKLLSEQMELKFTETLDKIEEVNGELQEQLNTVTKYFTFNFDGMTIGQSDSQNKVVVDNDEISILVNDTVVQTFDANGKSLIPELNVTRAFNLFGYLIDMDENGNVNCEYTGGDE